MSLNLVLVACFLACLQPIYTGSASFIKKCPATDSKCIKESAQAAIPIFAAGIPEFGIEKMDPLTMKNIDASSPNLKLKLKDISATGLSQCIVKKMQLNAEKTNLSVKLLCTVDAKGLYDMDGTVLILKIEGKGNAHVVLRKVLILAEAALSHVKGADGQIHWKIGKWNHSYELKEKATVELDNLFDGNEVLARAARELISDNPNEIVFELGPGIIKAVVEKIIKNVAKLFASVPMSELVE